MINNVTNKVVLTILLFLSLAVVSVTAQAGQEDLKTLLSQLQYPEHISVASASPTDGSAIIATHAADHRVIVGVFAPGEPVSIGGHMYMFQKDESGLKIRYIRDSRKVATEPLSVEHPFVSDDGYSVTPRTLSTPCCTVAAGNFIVQSGQEYYLYKYEGTDKGLLAFTRNPIRSGNDVLSVLKEGEGEPVGKDYGPLRVLRSFIVPGAAGYVFEARKVIPMDLFFDCNVVIQGQSYMICPAPVDFARFAGRFKDALEVKDAVVCLKPGKDCVQESSAQIAGLYDEKWHVAEAAKYVGFVSVKEAGLAEEHKADDKALEQKVTLNFREAPLQDAVASLCSQAKINVTFDKDLERTLTVTANYDGVSLDGALRSITAGLDITFKKKGGIYILTPYEEKYIEVNKLFDFSSNTSSGATAGNPSGSQQTGAQPPAAGPQASGASPGTSQAMPQGTSQPQAGQQSTGGQMSGSSSNSSSSDSYSEFGGYIDNFISNITKLLSPRGVITYLPSGFIYVKDRPSRIKAVEQMLTLDDAKREEINLKITLLRIDYNNEHQTGIDWQNVLGGQIYGKALKLDLAGNFLGALAGSAGAGSVKLTNSKGTINSMLKVLSQYGKIQIVHTWETRAMAGTMLPFELTQDVWYSQGSTVQVINNQTITSPMIGKESVGLKILLNPLLQNDGRYLVNTRIELSNVVGFQQVGDQQLPQTEWNYLKIPIKMSKDDTVVISGFKIKNLNDQSSGLPLLSKLPVLKYLFGSTDSTSKLSELSVVISIGSGPVKESLALDH
ncbi:MAG: type II secretion system protein GspD [Thermodesulfovibrionales bacterium]